MIKNLSAETRWYHVILSGAKDLAQTQMTFQRSLRTQTSAERSLRRLVPQTLAVWFDVLTARSYENSLEAFRGYSSRTYLYG